MVEERTGKTRNDDWRVTPGDDIKDLITSVEEKYEEGAPVEEATDKATEGHLTVEEVDRVITDPKQKGEVYEPLTDHLRTT